MKAGGLSPVEGRRWLLFIATIITILPLLIRQQSLLGLATLVGIFSIAALSLDLLKGFTGILSLGQAAFMAIGGYASALLTVRYSMPSIVALLAGVTIAGVVAWFLGYAVVRLSVENAALVTLGLGLIMQNLFLSLRDWTGGGSGIAGIPPLGFLGWRLGGDLAYYYAVWLLVLLVYLFLQGIVLSRPGRALKTIKADEQVAAALAINVYSMKLQVFVISAALSSLAGSLYVHFMQFISPEMVGLETSLSLVTMVILGGEGTLAGGILGAGFLKVAPQYVSAFRDYQLLINGLLLLVILRYMPRGIVGSLLRWEKSFLITGKSPAPAVDMVAGNGKEVDR